MVRSVIVTLPATLARGDDASELAVGEACPFVAQEGQTRSGPPQQAQVEGGSEEVFHLVGGLSHQFAAGVEDCRAAPEVESVFVADAVGVRDEGREETGVGFVDAFHPAGGLEFFVVVQAAARGSRGEEQDVGAVEPK